MKKLHLSFLALMLILTFVIGFLSNNAYPQATVNESADPPTILCGGCTYLSAYGSTVGNIVFSEDFNSGAPTGWAYTNQAMWTNPCSPSGVDGTIHFWMGDNSGVPRILETISYDLTAAVAGVVVCFDLLFATQTGEPADAPCEGPDEPDEGVYLQYSIDGGSTWVTIHYFDPNGGYDDELTNWNNWCFNLPPGAITSNTIIRWFQDNDSGENYDHWGIDNVQIFMNDPTYEIIWLHDGYNAGYGGGVNPTPVCPTVDTEYVVMITNGTDTAYDAITIVVEYPDVQVFAGADTSICSGDCATLNGDATVIVSPASQPTYQNNDLVPVILGDESVNINIQDLNMTQILAGSILEVCINGFTFTGSQICTDFGGCDCNGTPIAFLETCDLDISSFDVTLITPTGCEILLVPSGVATGTIYTDVCFIPSGGADINSGGFPSAGNWDPNEPFDNLVGCDANGVWTLNFNAPGGLGFGFGLFTGWSITFDDPEISYVPAFFWSPTTDMINETTLTPTVCPSGGPGNYTYTLTAEDTAGCVSQSDDVTVTVIDCGPCTMTASITPGPDIDCYGDCDGSATANPASGTSPYTYVWNDASSQTNNPAINLCAGIYNVTVTDNDACTATASVTITEPPELTSTGITTDETSPGACDGTIDLTVTGGTPSYTFIWTNSETTEDLSGLCAGFYTVTITDNNGCTATNTFQIFDVSCTLTASITDTTHLLCNGVCIGSATVTPADGNSPYTYLWDDAMSQTTATATGLCADTYSVTINDSGGGTDIFWSEDFNNGCNSLCLASAYSGPNGLWTITDNSPAIACGGATTPNEWYISCAENGEGAGNCGDGCGSNATLHVGNIPTSPNAPFWCPTGDCGAAYDAGGFCDLLVTPPSTETDKRAESPTIDGSGKSNITLNFVYMENGQGSTDNATLWYYDGGSWLQLIDLPKTALTCSPQGLWTAYSISLPASADNNPNIKIGFKWVNDDDGDGTDPSFAVDDVELSVIGVGCTTTTSVTITEPPELTSTGITTDESSPGACDGTIDLTVTGGTPSYTFIWTNTETTEDISGLCAGFYTVTITDNNGCTATNTFQIFDVPCTLTASITASTDVSCFGDCDGSAFVTPASGTGPFTYNWSNGATIENPDNLCAGTHNVTVTDADSCNATASPVTITEPLLLESSGTSTDESSPGACDGTIDLTPAGGTPTYTYIWDNSETTEDLSGLCSGWYNVTITDANGCTATNSFYINDVPCTLTASITASTDVLCNGDCNGTATVTPASGTAPFTYNWSNGATIENPDNLCAGTHNVTVTDADSCNATASVNITEPSVFTVITGGSTSICSGESAPIFANAVGVVSYSWSPASSLINPASSSPTATPATTTTYTVTVTDASGCTATGSVIITVFTSLNITLSTNDDTICAGDPATIDANIVGGNPPYLITLDGETIVSPPFTVYPDITTEYIVTVEVDCGEPEASITIIVLPAPPANMDANPLQGCEPLTVQFLENALNPDTLGQTYLWDFGDETISTVRNPEHTFENAGSYDITLTVTSKHGCTTIISNPDMITVYPQPDAGFSAEPQTVSILKPIIFFNNHSSYTDTCYWNFGDSLSSTNLSNNINPDHTYSGPGTYTVQLIVATQYGCRDTVESDILVKDEFTFYAPTAFSPDKDKVNDIFLPVGVGIDPDNFFMLIYDRWGEKVFVTHDLYQGWDGRIKGKEIGENGIYTWLVIYKDLKKVEHQKSGKVTLIR